MMWNDASYRAAPKAEGRTLWPNTAQKKEFFQGSDGVVTNADVGQSAHSKTLWNNRNKFETLK